MAAVIELQPASRRAKRQRREPTKAAKLAALRKQSNRVAETRDWSGCDTLRTLAYLARVAKPRARSIFWDGIKFPLRQGFAINSVLCPLTGQPLVGALAL